MNRQNSHYSLIEQNQWQRQEKKKKYNSRKNEWRNELDSNGRTDVNESMKDEGRDDEDRYIGQGHRESEREKRMREKGSAICKHGAGWLVWFIVHLSLSSSYVSQQSDHTVWLISFHLSFLLLSLPLPIFSCRRIHEQMKDAPNPALFLFSRS